MRITCKLRSQCPLFARAANVRWFRSGTKYGKSLAITGNNEKSGCKTAGKIGEILRKILYNSDSITPSRPLQVILDPKQHTQIPQQSHDHLGHQGVYSTAKTISLWFWWPSYFTDVKHFVHSCHQCQICLTYKVHIPPTISTPVTLFTKVYLDVMVMPKAQGYHYIVTARDDLSGAAEGQKLKKASACAISQFIL